MLDHVCPRVYKDVVIYGYVCAIIMAMLFRWLHELHSGTYKDIIWLLLCNMNDDAFRERCMNLYPDAYKAIMVTPV